jgi:hypothetical protein
MSGIGRGIIGLHKQSRISVIDTDALWKATAVEEATEKKMTYP